MPRCKRTGQVEWVSCRQQLGALSESIASHYSTMCPRFDKLWAFDVAYLESLIVDVSALPFTS